MICAFSILDRSICLLMAAVLLAGCGGNGDFIVVRNPLAEEFAGAHAARLERKAIKEAKKTRETRAALGEEDTRTFAAVKAGKEARAKTGAGAAAGEQAITMAAAEGEGIDTGMVHPHSAGEICYRCNGKGYRMQFAGSRGDYYLCEECGGTGRE